MRLNIYSEAYVDWTVEQNSPVVSTIRVPFQRKLGWEQWALLSSDRHFDNPKSSHKLQRRHLEQAKERGAFVLDIGDLFCAMQGKYDKRSNKMDVRPENQCDKYLDSLVDSAERLFGPYADQFAWIGTGNHENAILNRHETNLTERLVKRLQSDGAQVAHGGFRGWIRMLFESTSKGSARQSLTAYVTHGGNSNAPVTKGIIKTNRHATWIPDADIVASGHIHESWVLPITRVRLSSLGREYMDKQLHVQCSTYKDEFLDQSNGFHHVNDRPPKPLGAWWLKFVYCTDTGRIKVKYEEAD